LSLGLEVRRGKHGKMGGLYATFERLKFKKPLNQYFKGFLKCFICAFACENAQLSECFIEDLGFTVELIDYGLCFLPGRKFYKRLNRI
jgi:hypothetical protein